MGATIQELETQLSNLSKNYSAEPVIINFPLILNTGVADQPDIYGRVGNLFIADRDYTIVGIKACHNVVQTSADGAAISVFKVAGTVAPEDATLNLITDTAFSGNDALFKGFNLKGIAVNTVTDVTLTTKAETLSWLTGERLVWGCRGTITSTTVLLSVKLTRN